MSVFNWFSFTTRLVIEFTSNVSTSASAHTALRAIKSSLGDTLFWESSGASAASGELSKVVLAILCFWKVVESRRRAASCELSKVFLAILYFGKVVERRRRVASFQK
jgi:hypothetical protein